MNPKLLLAVLLLSAVAGLGLGGRWKAEAGELPSAAGYKVLSPLRHGNLTVFPVVAERTHATQEFLTLDDGLRSGEVVVTEYGQVSPLVRRRTNPIPNRDRAQVNQLVLVNNSKRPLILLAGEIVTGGKQDRVIGKDRIVPAESDPIDLSVFCVEPGRWTATSDKFGSLGVAMAAPRVRAKAMADKDQQKVWAEVQGAGREMADQVSAPAAAELGRTTSYARVMDNQAVKDKVDEVAAPIERNYSSLIGELRERNAVGVVVAVDGEIIWADLFASTHLLQKYWPKLIRSYASEAVVSHGRHREVDMQSAQAFLEQRQGRRETVESEPGVYRHTEISGNGFKAFELMSLLPKTGFDLHVAKMAE
jgi:hypothetical protein